MQRFSLYGVHKRDYQESVTIGQTDARTHARTHRQTPDKVIPMCRYASQATQKLEQTAVIVKYKFIKCKQSVEGSIISQILKLPYSNGDVNEMEKIQ